MHDLSIDSFKTDSMLAQISAGINAANEFVNRTYLYDLTQYKVIAMDSSRMRTNSIRLYRINKLILDDQIINDKLASVYCAVQNIEASLILLLQGTTEGVNIYIGIKDDKNVTVSQKTLYKSFTANFPGSELVETKNQAVSEILNNAVFNKENCNVSSVTVAPAPRDDDKTLFVQGIEKFIDALQGEEYSAIFIARPLSNAELNDRKRGLEKLYSTISPFSKTTLAYGENDSISVAEGISENFSHTVNESISTTLGTNSSKSHSVSKGTSTGINLGLSYGKNTSTTEGFSVGTSRSKSDTQGSSDTTGTGTNKTDTSTTGSNKTITIENTNKSVEVLLNNIDQQLERIKSCESYGVWETSAYFLADEIQTSIVAASTFKALVSGEQSGVESSYINIWNQHNQNTNCILDYIRHAEHPVFKITGSDLIEPQYVTPGNHISGKELPIFMGVPQKSVSGVAVTSIAEFGRNISSKSIIASDNSRVLPLGNIYHMGCTETNNPVNLDLDSFTSHCFITGSTGSGKSNTVSQLLQNFIRNKVPFLIIEPAKGEYKTDFGGVPDVRIFNSNPYMGAMLKINPFEFNPCIHILEHLDRLIDIFNSCWEMYAAMAPILKSAIEKAYTNLGWDLQNSIYMNSGKPIYPTFADVLVTLPKIISSSAYSADSKGDYTGALVTRVKSLTNGIAGQIFCDSYAISDNVLFDQNVIVDLSRIGSAETKSLIMGILVMKLSEYRMANAKGSNAKLNHITVLEEAHNLLKNTANHQGASNGNVIGKSVEMICNSIAEMRTYGEGFIIVDQSPSSVDIAAIKNTNTKIIMRIPEQHDCEAIGKSVGLNENQIKELPKLPVGVGAVTQNNWLEAVLCGVNKADNSFYKHSEVNTFAQIKNLRSAVLERILNDFSSAKTINLDALYEIVTSADISDGAKEEMHDRLTLLHKSIGIDECNRSYYISLLHLSGLIGTFKSVEDLIQGQEKNSERLTEWCDILLQHAYRLFSFKSAITYSRLLKRCLFALRWVAGDVDYAAVYRTLYQEVKK